MVRMQIYLTERQKRALERLTRRTGVSQSELVREAVDAMIDDPSVAERRALLAAGRSLRRGRSDLPDLGALGREVDRVFTGG